MSDYNFKLPFPPSVNGMWRAFRNRTILSKRGREYRVSAIAAINKLELSNLNIDGHLSVTLVLNPPTLRRFDIDNYPKAIFDALTHAGFWLDDEQVDRLTIKRGVKASGGNVEISIDVI